MQYTYFFCVLFHCCYLLLQTKETNFIPQQPSSKNPVCHFNLRARLLLSLCITDSKTNRKLSTDTLWLHCTQTLSLWRFPTLTRRSAST